MAYVTNADIQERLGNDTYIQLTDDDQNGAADVGVVDEARLAAEGEVNSYLARRYRVPIDLTTHADLADLLASITLDLVEFRLRARRPPLSEAATIRHTQAMDWLARLADGHVDLPSATAIAGNTARGALGTTTGDERLLTREELSGH